MNKQLLNYLENLEDNFAELVLLWNQYAVEVSPEDYIWDCMEDYANEMGADGLELARMVYFGEVSSWDDRVYINAYGNFVTCFDIFSSPIDLEVLAEWLEETQHEAFLNWQSSLPVAGKRETEE